MVFLWKAGNSFVLNETKDHEKPPSIIRFSLYRPRL